MQPITPVIPSSPALPTTYFAEDQPEYHTLPAITDPTGRVTTRWRFTWRERLRVLWTGDIYLSLLTFNYPLQPVRLQVEQPRLTDLLGAACTTQVASSDTAKSISSLFMEG